MPGIDVARMNHENNEFIDFEDDEYQRQLLRPVEIKEDVKLMEQRQRVSRILHSEAFHRELNKILGYQLQEGAVFVGVAGSATEYSAAAALQEISNLLLPQARLGCSVFNRGATMPIIPINDLRSLDTNISKQEKFLRCKLAAVYRLVDLHGWASGMMLHASARISKETNLFLINCYGLMNHEITARNLIQVKSNGELEGNSGIIDKASWALHSAIHNVDASMRCVIHIKTPSVIAVSCMKSGLLPVSEEAIKLGNVAIYEWGSSSMDLDVKERLAVEQKALGKHMGTCHCVLVRNQGILTRGKTVEETWRIASLAAHACEIQVRLAMVMDSSSLVSALKTESFTLEDLDSDIHFEALMRTLDATGYHSGYLYRNTPVNVDCKRRIHQQQTEDGHIADMEDEEVEIPPSATSFSGRGDNGYEDSVSKKKSGHAQWHVHIPNDYIREETEDPRSKSSCKVISWRQVSSDKRQTSGLVEMSSSPNQFAPQGCNPNELKCQQQKVKGKYFRDESSAGHQSRILRSLDTVDKAVMPSSGIEDDSNSRAVLVGAVSRGIISKQHRYDPSVYQSCFSPNPFDRVTDEDLKQYQKRVDRIILGLPSEEEVATDKCDVATSNDLIPREMSLETTTESACSAVVDHGKPIVAEVVQEAEQSVSPADDTSVLSPTRVEIIRSDTSGADMSHDDTEREGAQSSATAVTSGKKKKKKLKDMFSFRKKDKSK